MQRVRVVHWKAEEAGPLREVCGSAGFQVEFDEADLLTLLRAIRSTQPDAVVIDLTRAPSHGRQLAYHLRSSKSARHIPIIFVDGAAEKVVAVREILPDATFCILQRLPAAVKLAIRNPVATPVAPPTVMQSYGSRTTAQKLGIAAGMRVAIFDAPRDYAAVLGTLPADVELDDEPQGAAPVTLWFVCDPREYQAELPRMARLAAVSKLWMIWKKGSTNGLTQNLVREAANEHGLVDYKICSVNAQWSGMLFAAKKG